MNLSRLLSEPRQTPATATSARWCSLAARVLCVASLLGRVAAAQDEEEESLDMDDPSASKDEEEAPSEEEPSEQSEAGEKASEETLAPPEQEAGHGPALLGWYGSLESDVGLAKYEAEDEGLPDDTLYDHRGRFVVAPLLHIDVGSFFFEATGQLVAWVKNNEGTPLIAADDVWGKFGKMNTWDVQVGRFEAWRVYQKFPVRSHDMGPEFHSRGVGESAGGFDQFTLEDTGALVVPPVSSRSYYVHIYEVSHILFREEAGSIAFHYFPSKKLGLELHGKYGEQAQQNKFGGRLAAVGRVLPQLQLSAAAEYRTSRTGSPTRSPDPMRPGSYNECSNCGRSDQQGFGGGAVLGLGPVELALSAAFSKEVGYRAVDGGRDSELSRETTSFGGYAQFTAGSITLGGAANTTRRLDEADNFQKHLQAAGYIFYPIARDLSLKLVISYAVGEDDRLENRDNIPPPNNSFLGARLRLKYFFDVM